MTQNFEVHIIFMFHELFFLEFFFQPFNSIKNFLGLWNIQKQMVNWIWSIGCNLPSPVLECYVIQGTAHTLFLPGLHDFCLVEVCGVFLNLSNEFKCQPEFRHFLWAFGPIV